MKPQANSNRPEKILAIKEITELVEKSEYCFVLNYGGLTVSKFAELRKELAKAESAVKVVKNAYLAKVIVEFLKKNENASVKAAQLDTATLDQAQVEALSKLPSKDVMRAMFLGTLQAPASSLVRVFAAPLQSVLYVLKAKQDKDGSAA